MILVDTSVWIDHFHHSDEKLKAMLLSNQVCMHPFILGELSCGNISNRKEVLSLLRALRSIDVVLDEEVFVLIEDRKLFGRGLGFIDIHLLASAMIYQIPVWTRDKTLKRISGELGISY
ncbi:MAG: type II toxin-antitoxin system VapC family toxin [Bacteroidales bacterium]|nr:type II toxin-antitoxin system VapC family toxin [Bacteroidales bacterium]MDT8431759.1 type II toxin-antitoxin system VapC family toxin [Bacteroidales bacterium]